MKQIGKVITFQDSEMQDAIVELKQAETMFNNAQSNLRMEEANFRVLAARKRIEAIYQERGDIFVEKVVTAAQA